MEVDISDYVIEGVLSIECSNRLWRLVTYFSKFLNKIERNYEIYDKKMLAVIRGLVNWRYLLKDTKFKFKVQIDYKNLEYFMKVLKLNRRQAHQALYLLRFDFILEHVLGTKIEKANGLSRRPDWKVEVENDNNNQTLVKEQWIHSLGEVVIEESKVDIVEKIKKSQE